MSNELVTRAIELIKTAEEIHKASEHYYITVSIGRMDADVHISYFADGNPENGTFIQFSTGGVDDSYDIIFDEDLTQAVAFLDNVKKKVGV